MDKLVIEGPARLNGEVCVSGAKNAALPIIAATLLTDEPCTIYGVPALQDIATMIRIIELLGKKVEILKDRIVISNYKQLSSFAPYSLVSTMRASFCVLGPLVARLNQATVSLPGGCVIGVRPVDLHLKGLKCLDIDIQIEGGYVVAKAKNGLKGKRIYLGGEFGPSVTATANLLMASTMAKGTTVIEAAACEPEIQDLACFLTKMGAKISGAGTPMITIEGVEKLSGTEHEVIPDRIEAGTFMIAAAITGGDVLVKNCIPEHMGAVIDSLTNAGVYLKAEDHSLRVKMTSVLQPVNITTFPYPGFPTDLQAQMMSLMCVTKGIGIIHEKIYPDRFMHVAEVNRMGARILREGPYAVVHGVKRLSGASVMASDLRASAALVLAGLAAEGKTTISRIYHLDRGYEKLDAKLKPLGAKIYREKDVPVTEIAP